MDCFDYVAHQSWFEIKMMMMMMLVSFPTEANLPVFTPERGELRTGGCSFETASKSIN